MLSAPLMLIEVTAAAARLTVIEDVPFTEDPLAAAVTVYVAPVELVIAALAAFVTVTMPFATLTPVVEGVMLQFIAGLLTGVPY